MTRRWCYQTILALLTLLTATEGWPVSELVFLLDRSGSVGAAHFEAEKGFVESFLAQVSVHPNASRVAVISYSNDAVVHVDYLREPKSKCELQEELQGVEYTDSRATNTRAALDKAREVLRNARPGVRKVVLLISDGVATAGGPPGEAATRLKEEGVELYCVGVGREAKEELMALASSPAHVYSCSGFTDFRRLARQIRGDPHESSWSSEKGGCDHLCDSPYRGEAGDPGCCDGHARCSCALKAGLRDCVCAPGYFGLSGLWGRCTPCPRGSYKAKLEPAAACTPCPKGSTTQGLASTSLKQCVCQEGFRGTPGEECSKVRCPPLQAPPSGFVTCEGSEFGSECVFGCEAGFELASPSDDVRTCRANGTWSGSTASCQRVQCSQPQPSPGLQVRCSQPQPLSGARCRFACFQGYLLEGSAERECLDTKRWSGEPPSCVPVKCPLPPRLANGMSSCPSTKRPLFGEVCAFRCHQGFRLKGPFFLQCAADATLRPLIPSPGQPLPFCTDEQPPELLCPASRAAAAGRGGGALVSWAVPLPSDNDPRPPSLSPVFRLPMFLEVGTHTFEYVATDAAALSTTCSFTVRVYDDESPRVLRCPETVEVTSEDWEAAVFWEEPLFEDISRFTVQQSRRPGDLFSLGEETVTYRATDDFGNSADCTFQVKVSQTTCPFFPPPANGALSCDDLHFGSVCGVSCNEHFDFSAPPADLYVCNGQGNWVTDPLHMPLPWPDCTTAVSPGMLRLKAQGFYFHGDCRLPSTQMQIRKQFSSRLLQAHPDCFQRGLCTLDRVRVLCGRKTTRRRRDLFWPQGEDFELEFEITLHGDLQLNETDAVLQNFLEAIQHLGWEEETTTPSPEVNRTMVISEERAEVVCRPGSVLTNNKCMLCPSGTFFDGGQCSDCPLGHFQEQEGQEGCEQCPNDTSTEQPRARNHTDCKTICGPGTFSSSGLATCLACPIGTFQPRAGQSLCDFCPGTTTTLSVQSSSPYDCRERCAMGYFSKGGGLAPCSPCPLGFFQPSPEQSMCLECPRNLSTLVEAATDVVQCQEVDPCPDDWCQHGGTCTPEGRRGTCTCPEGWEGGRCERDVDECLPSNPCLNRADCLNTEGSFQCSCSEGFYGVLCGEELDECLSSPCLNNATCLDEVNGFRCVCGAGFYGARCEHERKRCSLLDVECGHGGRCVDDGSGQTVCECTPGYSGVDCSIELDECQDVVCEHNGSCANGECACAPGYTGALCETEVDECLEGHRCAKGATCNDLVARYECICPPGWAGVYCESRLSEDFVLNFPEPGSLANAASVQLRSALAQATVSLWVQTAAGGRDQATPLSYAAGVSDNAMTLSDCGALTLSLNNEPLLTDVAVHDGSWHHLAFAYDDSGSWRLWKDGALASEGQRQEGGAPVEGGGALVLGQEQDSLGGDFSPAETFTGNISRVNVWDVYLSPSNVTRLCRLDDDLPGKVVAWPDFLAGVSGDVRVLNGHLPTQDWAMQ